VEIQRLSPIPNEVFHDLIPVYLEKRRAWFYSHSGQLRFLPFGGAYRFGRQTTGLERGFLCFDVLGRYSAWYLPASVHEAFLIAPSFEEMMKFPQRRKK
jgi:hypothetical protein